LLKIELFKVLQKIRDLHTPKL